MKLIKQYEVPTGHILVLEGSKGPMKPQYKVGDWVVCEWKIQMVKRVEDSRVTEVTDGIICRSSQEIIVFPLTLRNKLICDYFDYYYKELEGTENEHSLNWPGISYYFENMFNRACSIKELVGVEGRAKANPKLEKVHKELHAFVHKTKDTLLECKRQYVKGVRILK